MNWMEKREKEREIACFTELWFSRMLVFVGYDYKEIKVLYLITVIIVTLSREFDIGQIWIIVIVSLVILAL